MKTIITIALILISSVCYGQERLVIFNSEKIAGITSKIITTKTICIDGNEYLIVVNSHGLSVGQKFKINDNRTKPIKCEKDK